MAQLIADKYRAWEQECQQRFYQLKANEEELNRIFIEIYGLQNEITYKVQNKDLTIRKANLQREIKSLISYAVGCWFGRYSVDCKGICYAGGVWDASKYKTIIPVKDNILPICDDAYFSRNLTSSIIEFICKVYGEETLEENLKFVADALAGDGKGTPRKIIQNYLLTGFYADHFRIYQNKPIYWLFHSGKKHAFEALVYMHRWNKKTVSIIRKNYIHKLQECYTAKISILDKEIDTANTSEYLQLKKQSQKLKEQLIEINAYEIKVGYLADKMIDIDLDDGVSTNYAKFADILKKIRS